MSKGKNVLTKGPGASKAARKVAKDAKPGKKLRRHDGHKLENGKTGMPHHQTKSGDGSHAFYSILGGILTFIGEMNPLHSGELGEKAIGNEGEDVDNDGIQDNEDYVDNSRVYETDDDTETDQEEPETETEEDDNEIN